MRERRGKQGRGDGGKQPEKGQREREGNGEKNTYSGSRFKCFLFLLYDFVVEEGMMEVGGTAETGGREREREREREKE